MQEADQKDTDIRIADDTLCVELSGKLDTMRAMSLDEQLNAAVDDTVVNIAFDFEGLNYIASAGLRILYWAKEYTDEKGGSLSVEHISDEIADIFEMTGFNDILNID